MNWRKYSSVWKGGKTFFYSAHTADDKRVTVVWNKKMKRWVLAIDDVFSSDHESSGKARQYAEQLLA